MDNDPLGIPDEQSYSMTKNRMIFAFGIESSLFGHEPKDDPHFLQWVAFTQPNNGDVSERKYYQTRKC